MAESIKVLNADVSVDRSYVFELAKQYDNLTRKYRVIITDKGVPIALNGNEGVLLRMQAEGEATPYVEKWLDWENNWPIIVFTSNMLSKIGLVHFEFAIFDAPGGTGIISTRQQNLSIQKSFTDRDGLITSDDFDVLSSLITDARAVIDNMLTKSDLVNDANQTESGIKALDAAMGKTLQNEINANTSNIEILQNQTELNTTDIELLQNNEFYKGMSINLDTLIENSTGGTSSAFLYSYSGSATGVPSANPGYVLVYYYDTDTTLQYAYDTTGNRYFRKNISGTISNWDNLGALSKIVAVDTKGLLGTAGANVDAQELSDEMADRISTKLIPYDCVVNNGTTTESGFVLDARYGKTLSDNIALNTTRLNNLFVSVKDYGAKGDNITDDTNAIISAIGSGNRTVYFPTGVYLTNPINITVQNISFVGDGWFSSQLRLISDGSALTFKNGSSAYIEKITFNPNTAISTAITSENNTSLRIYNCIFYNNTQYGFKAAGSAPGISGNMIQNCYFTSNTGIAHIDTTYWNDFVISNCEFGRISKSSYNMNYLMCLQNSSNGVIYGCSFWEGIKGIYFYQCYYNRFINNRIESNSQYGFELEACKYSIISNCWFSDNSVSGANSYNHLTIKGGNTINVSNNIFSDWNSNNYVKYCIEMRDGCSDCSINNNSGDNYTTGFIAISDDTALLNNNYDGGYTCITPSKQSNGTFYIGSSFSSEANGAVIIAPFDMTIVQTQIDVDFPATGSTDYKYELEVNGTSRLTWYSDAGQYIKLYTDEYPVSKGSKIDIKCTLSNITTPCHHTISLNYVKR